MAIHFVRYVARRVRTAARFNAPDPWNGAVVGEFSLEECSYLPEHLNLSSPKAIRAMGLGGTVFLLRCERDGAERLLPEALAELWKTGQVPVNRLPELMLARRGAVKMRDALPILHRKVGRPIGFALLAAVVGIGGFLLGRNAYRGQVESRRSVRMEAEAWLAMPAAAGQRLMLGGFLPLAGRDDEVFEPTVPKEVTPPLDRQALLAWATAAEGHRLIMVPPRSFRFRDKVEVNQAIVVETAQVGIPPAILARVRGQVPDLDDGLVLCSNWRIDPNALGLPGSIAAGGFLLGLFGVAGFVGAVLAAPILRQRQQVRRREMAAILARLGGAHG